MTLNTTDWSILKTTDGNGCCGPGFEQRGKPMNEALKDDPPQQAPLTPLTPLAQQSAQLAQAQALAAAMPFNPGKGL